MISVTTARGGLRFQQQHRRGGGEIRLRNGGRVRCLGPREPRPQTALVRLLLMRPKHTLALFLSVVTSLFYILFHSLYPGVNAEPEQDKASSLTRVASPKTLSQRGLYGIACRAIDEKKDASPAVGESDAARDDAGETSEDYTELLALAAVFACLIIAAVTNRESISTFLNDFASGLKGQGALGIAKFGLAYVVLEMLAIPATPLTISAGALFGVGRGVLVVSAAGTAAASLGFLVARYAIREKVERFAAAKGGKNWAAINRALQKDPLKVIALLRLSPLMPFSVSNYLYGLTAIDFPSYLAGSWAGMLPGTFWYVAAGDFGAELIGTGFMSDGIANAPTAIVDQIGAAGAGGMGLAGAGLAAGMVFSLGSAGFIAKLLQEALAEGDAADAEADGDAGGGGGAGGSGRGSS